MTQVPHPYQYVVMRCVPRVDRQEFINLGVLLYCEATQFLEARWHFDEPRVAAFAPGLDRDAVREGAAFVDAVCFGDGSAGGAAAQRLGTRFGFLKAPRSTVLQPGPVHGGTTRDPATELDCLVDRLVR